MSMKASDAVERCPPKEKNIFLTNTLIILHTINYVEVWKPDGPALYSPVSRKYEFYKVNINYFFLLN